MEVWFPEEIWHIIKGYAIPSKIHPCARILHESILRHRSPETPDILKSLFYLCERTDYLSLGQLDAEMEDLWDYYQEQYGIATNCSGDCIHDIRSAYPFEYMGSEYFL